MKYLLPLIFLVGCSSSDYVAGTITAKNGHSMVSQYNKTSEIECESSGTRLDFFIDMDDSLLASDGDIYTNSVVVCDGINGLNGLQGERGEQGAQGAPGPQGIQGLVGPQGIPGMMGMPGPTGPQGATGATGATGSSGATIRVYNVSTCTLITGTSTYIKSNAIYSSSSCNSNTKIEELNDGESYFVSNNSLLISSGHNFRVITFN